MSDKNNLQALHELISTLEDSNNHIEASLLHDQFVKLSQAKMPDVSTKNKHPYDKGEEIKVLPGDTGLTIANRLLKNNAYIGRADDLWERIKEANGVKPERGFLGISKPTNLKVTPGMPLLYPKPNQAERSSYERFVKGLVNVEAPKKPFGRPSFD